MLIRISSEIWFCPPPTASSPRVTTSILDPQFEREAMAMNFWVCGRNQRHGAVQILRIWQEVE